MSDTDTVLPTDNALLAPLVKAVLPKIAQAILGIGRTKMYEELGKGNLAAVRDGPTRILITTESIKRYQENRPAAVFRPPKPPRLENLDRLREKHAAQRRAKRAERRRSKARGE